MAVDQRHRCRGAAARPGATGFGPPPRSARRAARRCGRRSGRRRRIVGDQDDRQAAPVAQVQQQPQDLRLHRHVERRRRLVGDQDPRVAGQRGRDHRALPHADGELVRIGGVPACRIGNADLARAARSRRPAPRRRAQPVVVGGCPRRSGRRSRITGSRWLVGFWKTMPMAPPRTARSLASLGRRQVAPVEQHLAGRDVQPSARAAAAPARGRAGSCPSRSRRPGRGSRPRQIEGHAVDQPARARAVPQVDGELADGQQRRGHSCTAQAARPGHRRAG